MTIYAISKIFPRCSTFSTPKKKENCVVSAVLQKKDMCKNVVTIFVHHWQSTPLEPPCYNDSHIEPFSRLVDQPYPPQLIYLLHLIIKKKNLGLK